MDEHIVTREFQLEGLHCKDCAETIEKTICKMGGVHSARAIFASSKVRVSYDPDKAKPEDLIRSVENIGYRVKHDGAEAPRERILWKDREFLFTLLSGLSLGIGLFIHFFTNDPVLFAFLRRSVSASTVLYLIAIFFGAFYFSREGWASVKALRFNMDFLMSVAIVGAVIIQEYVEAASLAFLFSLAELLEGYAVERARNSLRQLMKVAPNQAQVLRDGREVTVPIQEVRKGEVAIVRPGEKVTVDGTITEGASSLDQSPITGESVPVGKEAGEPVYAGSINLEGYLEIKVTEAPENTLLSRIIQMVEEAEALKAPSERFVEKFARIYTPAVVALAICVAVLPPLFLNGVFNVWFVKALTLLVIACPCALVISTPVSVVSALTSASRNGVLIKGGMHLENMANVNAIALDKTGTLTTGELQVTDIVAMNGKSQEDIVRIAAALEKKSEHPIARAIMESANGEVPHSAQNFVSIPGKGVTATLNEVKFYIGRRDLFESHEVELPEEQLQLLQQQGKTTMLVGTQTEIFGIIALADRLRAGTIETIAKLKATGKEIVMITGDNEETARAIARQLGITHFHAQLLPNEKVDEIKYLLKEFGKVAMVGDGVNDAPALAAATVGIAMGAAGSDTALETADIALMADDLSKLPYLVELSQTARLVIKQNIWASIFLKFSLAIGVFPGIVSLVIAVLVGDMGASLGVTSNALRLARVQAK